MPKLDLFQNNRLTDIEKQTINEALFYATREMFNEQVEINKNEIIRKALELMKKIDQVPDTSHSARVALDSFFGVCVKRGWQNELKDIPWLKLKEDNDANN